MLDGLQALNLVPVSPAHAETCAAAFGRAQQTPELLRNLPAVLLTAMQCLELLHRRLRGSADATGFLHTDPVTDGGRRQRMEHLRAHARALVAFAGMIPFRLPGNTNAELIRLQVAMSA